MGSKLARRLAMSSLRWGYPPCKSAACTLLWQWLREEHAAWLQQGESSAESDHGSDWTQWELDAEEEEREDAVARARLHDDHFAMWCRLAERFGDF